MEYSMTILNSQNVLKLNFSLVKVYYIFFPAPKVFFFSTNNATSQNMWYITALMLQSQACKIAYLIFFNY